MHSVADRGLAVAVSSWEARVTPPQTPLQLGLHVSSPASLPTLQFLGAEKSLVGYRSALNARLALWRPERSVRLNLEAVLDVKFPSSQKVRAPFPSSRSRSVSSDL